LENRWDSIRQTRVVFNAFDVDPRGSGIVHESTLRSFRVVQEMRDMLKRGDSPGTILSFLDWVESHAPAG
jgi:hypothetical protein